MRVIAGVHKGRPLKAVPSRLTRPTTDKVKEALFQMIGPYFDGGIGLDLFAGSGNLGIEAISRGLDRVIFVDQQPKAIQTIYDNVKMLRIEDRAEVFRTEAFRALKAAAKRELAFDYIFLDPPYGKVSYEQLIETAGQYSLLTESGMIVCEHEAKVRLPDQVANYKRLKSDTYGNTTAISLYQLTEEVTV
ncbi:16S rRNA (guanine(966)-N(2))-methyltransferase RsmD [Aquibacillus sp. 3ASR75-11]|uniref:16S rRNA (Guanine(966)-N(2))-methyltransferase RsmD n=1 Tax=Terrihalobacillus insolitus TaxID=2950438 RepID=A0A9X4AKV6_9BACI|nr:16S rRNA (guanine(966)-N(2))-methyltransferase RsmD [Terrihalobacillus insolitus]MDC3412811.1 16S rRNA (guanine(966)-N(2))-methyltransferase RsmD [Terrihalobacillus insolitus]MDC3423712.1 16S rRNA (guanine(966)-N(2))-methyltransferase RsmD [Terrihalobacillus insolitus]